MILTISFTTIPFFSGSLPMLRISSFSTCLIGPKFDGSSLLRVFPLSTNNANSVTWSMQHAYVTLSCSSAVTSFCIISLRTRESRTATGQKRSTVPPFSQRKGTLGEKKELESACADVEKGQQKGSLDLSALLFHQPLSLFSFSLFSASSFLSRPPLNSSTLPFCAYD